jgi:Na+-transporting methylmalonyl-CoA/oxaloacetate decarboxylase gamma subunit
MELLIQALTIMSVGMALVFAFLAVTIGGIIGTARLIRRYEERQAAAAQAADPEAARVVAAIAVALTEQGPAPR